MPLSPETALTLALLLSSGAAATPPPTPVHFTLAASACLASNAPAPTRLTQAAFPLLRFTSDFESRPSEPPILWAVRLSRWRNDRAWALELMHHKLYLTNAPPEIESFSISHGYNLVTLQRIWKKPEASLSLLAGVVVAHPESSVRGMRRAERGGELGGGYDLAGPVVGGGIARSIALLEGVAVVGEARATLSRVAIPIAEGEVRFTLAAAHLLLGVELSR